MSRGWSPEAVGALATAGATLFAAGAASIAASDPRGRRTQDQRRQVELIGAWAEVDRSNVQPDGSGVVRRVHVANRSDLSVTNVIVGCLGGLSGEEGPTFRLHSLGPGEVIEEVGGRGGQTLTMLRVTQVGSRSWGSPITQVDV